MSNHFLCSSEDQTAAGGTLSLNADVEITCTTCYTKGTITTLLSTTGDFNAPEAISNIIDEFENDIVNLTKAAIEDAETYAEKILGSVFHLHHDSEDIPFPTFDFDFNLDVPGIPEVSLQFQFDGIELYVELDTSLSLGATYTLSLYTSETPIGIAVSDELMLGAVLTIDLILDVEGEIDITSGFHLQLDDGVVIDIELFNTAISSLTL
jgi:hypothetical protein